MADKEPTSTTQTVRQRILDSALDFALNAFWVAAVGAAVTAIAIVFAFWGDLPLHWIWAFIASFVTFIFVVATTTGVVWLVKTRRSTVRPVGRKGLLDFIHDRDAATQSVVRSLAVLNIETGRIGEQVGKKAERLLKAQASGAQHRVYRISRRTAKTLERRATRIEIHVQRFAESVDVFTESTNKWLTWMKNKGKPIQSDEFTIAIRSLRTAMAGAIPNTRGFRDAFEENRDISADLDVAGGRLVSALDQMIAGMTRTVTFCDSLLDTKG